jgi:hypothetical protein
MDNYYYIKRRIYDMINYIRDYEIDMDNNDEYKKLTDILYLLDENRDDTAEEYDIDFIRELIKNINEKK